MFTRKFFFIAIVICYFFVAFLSGRIIASVSSKEDTTGKATSHGADLQINSSSSESNNSSLLMEAEKGSYPWLLNRLLGKVDVEELNVLFNEAFDPDTYVEFLSERKRILIIQKWGELAPLQGLQKLEETPDGKNYLFPLFSGWVSKNPEAAIACYEERFRKDERYSPIVLNAIIGEYALQSPEKAWNYLLSYEGEISSGLTQKIKQRFLEATAESHPELIPDMVKRVGLPPAHDKVNLRNMGAAFYKMGVQWGKHNSESREWLENLPDEFKRRADAGRIMGITNGDVDKINDYLLPLSPEDQKNTAKELWLYVWSGGIDLPNRIDWIMESLPASEIDGSIEHKIMAWQSWDYERSQAWIDSLPSGAKKERLQKWQNIVDSRRNFRKNMIHPLPQQASSKSGGSLTSPK